MANVFGTGAIAVNPIVVDTAWAAGSPPAGLTAIAQGGPQKFRRIVWEGATTIGNTVTITDQNSNVLFNVVASVANAQVTLWEDAVFPYTFKQSNWAVTVISSGKLLFYK